MTEAIQATEARHVTSAAIHHHVTYSSFGGGQRPGAEELLYLAGYAKGIGDDGLDERTSPE